MWLPEMPLRELKGIGKVRASDLAKAGLQTIEDLLTYASAVGALCCTKYGARPAIPTAKGLAEFFKKHQKMQRKEVR